jgi:hypothetical protein
MQPSELVFQRFIHNTPFRVCSIIDAQALQKLSFALNFISHKKWIMQMKFCLHGFKSKLKYCALLPQGSPDAERDHASGMAGFARVDHAAALVWDS